MRDGDPSTFIRPEVLLATLARRARSTRKVWPLALVALVPLTCVAVASVSAWLVIPYLVVIAGILFTPATQGPNLRAWQHALLRLLLKRVAAASSSPRPHFAGAQQGQPAAVPVSWVEAEEPDDESAEGASPDAPGSWGEQASGLVRRGRGRGRARTKAGAEASSQATWVRIGPGKFVRVEEPVGGVEAEELRAHGSVNNTPAPHWVEPLAKQPFHVSQEEAGGTGEQASLPEASEEAASIVHAQAGSEGLAANEASEDHERPFDNSGGNVEAPSAEASEDDEAEDTTANAEASDESLYRKNVLDDGPAVHEDSRLEDEETEVAASRNDLEEPTEEEAEADAELAESGARESDGADEGDDDEEADLSEPIDACDEAAEDDLAEMDACESEQPLAGDEVVEAELSETDPNACEPADVDDEEPEADPAAPSPCEDELADGCDEAEEAELDEPDARESELEEEHEGAEVELAEAAASQDEQVDAQDEEAEAELAETDESEEEPADEDVEEPEAELAESDASEEEPAEEEYAEATAERAELAACEAEPAQEEEIEAEAELTDSDARESDERDERAEADLAGCERDEKSASAEADASSAASDLIDPLTERLEDHDQSERAPAAASDEMPSHIVQDNAAFVPTREACEARVDAIAAEPAMVTHNGAEADEPGGVVTETVAQEEPETQPASASDGPMSVYEAAIENPADHRTDEVEPTEVTEAHWTEGASIEGNLDSEPPETSSPADSMSDVAVAPDGQVASEDEESPDSSDPALAETKAEVDSRDLESSTMVALDAASPEDDGDEIPSAEADGEPDDSDDDENLAGQASDEPEEWDEPEDDQEAKAADKEGAVPEDDDEADEEPLEDLAPVGYGELDEGGDEGTDGEYEEDDADGERDDDPLDELPVRSQAEDEYEPDEGFEDEYGEEPDDGFRQYTLPRMSWAGPRTGNGRAIRGGQLPFGLRKRSRRSEGRGHARVRAFQRRTSPYGRL